MFGRRKLWVLLATAVFAGAMAAGFSSGTVFCQLAPHLRFMVDVSPCILLWMLAAKGYTWLQKRPELRYSRLTELAYWTLLLSLPIAVNADVIGKTLWTVRFRDAFTLFSNMDFGLGLWRVLLAVFALSVTVGRPDRVRRFGGAKETLEDCLFMLVMLATLCLILVFVGEAICLAAGYFNMKPTGNIANVQDAVWLAGRHMVLGGAYTFASMLGFFAGFASYYVVAPLTWAAVGAFAAVSAFFLLTSSAAAYVGISATSLNMRALKLHGKPRKHGLKVKRGPTGLFEDRGMVYARVNVANPNDGRTLNLKLLVDTGASFTRISEEKLRAIGVKPVAKCVEKLADGRLVERRSGYVNVEYAGRKTLTQAVFAEKGDVEALGIAAIRQLKLFREHVPDRAPTRRDRRTAQPATQQPTNGQSTMERGHLAPYAEFMVENCDEIREKILNAGFVAVSFGRDPVTGRNVFYAIPTHLAEKLVSGGNVAPEEESLEVLELMRLRGYVERGDGGYRLKSEDVERDLKMQLMKLRELCVKRVAAYVV
jgi:predicted aspartyl protease